MTRRFAAEALGTAFLLAAVVGSSITIAGAVRYRSKATAAMVGLYISAAYWFTASTSFANPAVTVARALSNSFAGIAPHSAPAFVVAQLLGAIAAFIVFGWLFAPSATAHSPAP